MSYEVWTSGSPLLGPAGAHCIRIFDNNFRRELEGISFVQPSIKCYETNINLSKVRIQNVRMSTPRSES